MTQCRLLWLATAVLAATPLWAGQIGRDGIMVLPRADVVILGEVHDNPAHHENQARAVAAIRPKALVFEMLTPEQAVRAVPSVRGDQSALSEALGWDGSGWPDFSLYYPIFAAAPQAAILGGALPHDDVRRAMRAGAAPVFGAGAGLYGLTMPLAADEQAAREADQQAAHCGALPQAALPGMVAAQRLRDAALARAVVQAMAQTGGPVVVITGTGHARKDRGIPAALALAAPAVNVVSVGQLESDPGPSAPYDFWVVTAPADRPDPCAAFR